MADIFELFKQIGKKEEATGAPEWIIAGLGNPGREYEKTRHNAGYMAIDRLAGRLGADVLRSRFRSLTGMAVMGGHRVLLMKPLTYMNLSGEAIREAADFYRIPAEKILVLVDDVYLPAGRMRIRGNGSDGGHNGLANIIYQLGKNTFPRIRIGVGEKPNPEYDMKDWVLGKIPEGDLKRLQGSVEDIYDAALLMMDGKLSDAMCAYNGKVHT